MKSSIEIDISDDIKVLLKLLAEPRQPEKLTSLLERIIDAIKSGSIEGAHKKRRKFHWNMFASEEDSDEDSSKTQHDVSYIDTAPILAALANQQGYENEFEYFLRVITFSQIHPIDFKTIIHSCVQSQNEKYTYSLISKYMELNGDLNELFPNVDRRGRNSIFQLLLKNNYEESIQLIMSKTLFETQLNKNELIASILTEEEFVNATKRIDFSDAKMPFKQIKEDVLIKYYELFPDTLEKGDIEFYDDQRWDQQWFRGNIYEYAAYKKYNKFLTYLINNQEDSQFVSSQYIKSVAIATQLDNSKITISNPEENVFCLEVMLKQDHQIPEFDLTEKLIGKAIKNELGEFVKFALNNAKPELISQYIEHIISKFAFTNQPDLITQTLLWLKKQNSKHEYDSLITDLFKFYLYNPGNEPLILSLLKHHSDLINNLKTDPGIERIITASYNPKIIKILLENKFPVPAEKIKESYITASIENDENSQMEFAKYLEEKDRVDLWKYGNLESTKTSEISAKNKIYGSGISQEQFHVYQQLMVDNITSQMLQGNFKLLPSGFNTNELAQKVDDYEAPFSLDKVPDHLRKNEKILFSLAEKYQKECTLFSLGAFRHSVARVSKPNEPGSCEFGQYRKPLESGQHMATGLGGQYEVYLNKFLSTQYDKYKNTKYLNGSDTIEYGHLKLPLCSIVGYIDEKPIELTKYAETFCGYSWSHTEPEQISEILTYCQKLINELITLNIDIHSVAEETNFNEKIGTLHWWLAHACPFNRGSAAITEAICKAIFQIHGFKIDWNLMPDCEALITPSVEDYARNYSSLFKYTPLPLKKEAIETGPDIFADDSPLSTGLRT